MPESNTMDCLTCANPLPLPKDRPMAILCRHCGSLILFEEVSELWNPRQGTIARPPRVATRLDWLALSDRWPRIHAALTCDLTEISARLWKEREEARARGPQ